MYLNFLIHFVLLCSANPSNSFAGKIAFFGQRKKFKNVSILVLRVAMRFMKFYYFSPHHLIGVGNNVNLS